MAAFLCAVVGFALVAQLRQVQEDEFSSLRQSDLVRILDDVTRQADSLEKDSSQLRQTEFELRSGTEGQRAAQEAAQKNAEIQGILSGRLSATGPGIEITILDANNNLRASHFVTILTELRNAGAEVMEINGQRVITSTYFADSDNGLIVDGKEIKSPYHWVAIGDPKTLTPALEIPGGAMSNVRNTKATVSINDSDKVIINSTIETPTLKAATPVTENDS